MAGALKRTRSSFRKSTEIVDEENERHQAKRYKSESFSSTESLSESFCNDCPFEGEASSDSEFEDHRYSKSISSFSATTRTGFKRTREQMTHVHMSETSNPKRNRTKPKCESKNAVMARLNRQKKKKYIEDLETRNDKLESENQLLKEMLQKRAEESSTLKKEVSNLHNVIRNRTEIGTLLKCIHENTNLQVTSSLLNTKPGDSQSDTSERIRNRHSTLRLPSESEGLVNFEEGNEKKLVLKGKISEKLNNADTSMHASPEELFLDGICYQNIELDKSSQLLTELGLGLGLAGCSKSDIFDDPMLTASPVSKFDPDELLRCETPTSGLPFNGGLSEELPLFGELGLGLNLGVCLHVSDKKVSLEFCESCNQKASFHM